MHYQLISRWIANPAGHVILFTVLVWIDNWYDIITPTSTIASLSGPFEHGEYLFQTSSQLLESNWSTVKVLDLSDYLPNREMDSAWIERWSLRRSSNNYGTLWFTDFVPPLLVTQSYSRSIVLSQVLTESRFLRWLVNLRTKMSAKVPKSSPTRSTGCLWLNFGTAQGRQVSGIFPIHG